MNRSVQEAGGELLIVSHSRFSPARERNRPSYIRAARPEIAIPRYEEFLRKAAEDLGKSVQSGQFGADMKVSLINDGPSQY